jgi:hypothetical protein
MSGVIGGRVGACVFASSDRGAGLRVSTTQFLQKRARTGHVKSSQVHNKQVKSSLRPPEHI